ncbi:SDR family NAD(P)-dependent oxidoreductase [Nonomuraea phyllanthi]|uniref:SDR family NAD(P)-dependent oxidoreductase n=1 Tax=Nonomuraea phyllanthi TaxID=2219224 RepID=A0A5C4W8M3_9ACTN|nr:SDR family oxidoreductase [Nonomuraea phyllanthi]KAB8192365.1 SDR family NAD(P)-dependent oxidoreductase [Nonomuraea phyllanthi]QFY11281.1 SDR family NAD(P)-dependent oxidoreductase [Nonomuraea phyllanthi]
MPTALITGATSGIGAAFARRLAAEGFSLVLVSRDEHRLAGAAGQLKLRYGVSSEVLPADLATEEGLARVESRLAEGVDVLVNNAGFGNPGRFPDVPVEDEVRMLKVHCEAVLRLTLAALPGMRERERGAIINVASVAAFFPRGTYSASKAWVVNFSESAAADVGDPRIRIMALCPGFVRTEFHRRSGMDTAGIPGFLWLKADDVVRAAMRDLALGRRVSVPDPRYKAIVAIGRLVPRGLQARVSAAIGR